MTNLLTAPTSAGETLRTGIALLAVAAGCVPDDHVQTARRFILNSPAGADGIAERTALTDALMYLVPADIVRAIWLGSDPHGPDGPGLAVAARWLLGDTRTRWVMTSYARRSDERDAAAQRICDALYVLAARVVDELDLLAAYATAETCAREHEGWALDLHEESLR